MCAGARKTSDTAGAAAADLAAARALAADGRGAPKRRRGSPRAALAFFARTGDVFMSSGGKVSSTLLNVCLKPVPVVSGTPRGVNSLLNICFQSVEDSSNRRRGSAQGHTTTPTPATPTPHRASCPPHGRPRMDPWVPGASPKQPEGPQFFLPLVVARSGRHPAGLVVPRAGSRTRVPRGAIPAIDKTGR